MTRRTWILIGLALVGGLIAWWAVGGRPAKRDEALTRDLAVEPQREAALTPEQEAGATEALERERVVEAARVEPIVTHRLTGRVVDPTRRPVAGAHVELHWRDLVPPSTSSDADGRFSLEAALGGHKFVGRAFVWARDASGRSGHALAGFPPVLEGAVIERELGTIVLGPAHSLRVRVIDGEAPVAHATLRVALGHERLLFEERTTDARGEVVLEGLEPGPVHLTASAPGREGRLKLFVPEEQRAQVELQPLGTATVIVLDAESGAPVVDAELELHEFFFVPAAVDRQDRMGMPGESLMGDPGLARTYRSDGEGRARIDGLSDEVRYELSVRARGYDEYPGRRRSRTRLNPGPEPFRVELAPRPLRSVRWPIVAGELPVPLEGTSLELRFSPGTLRPGRPVPALPGPARVEGAEVVVENVSGRAKLLGETPDGAIARLWIGAESVRGDEVSFRGLRRIELRVRDLRGAPVLRARATARGQGNNELCAEVTTDADGRATLEGLYGGLAEVYVGAPGASGRGAVIGSVDLDKGHGSIEATLIEPVVGRARIAVRTDGQSRLPARFSVYAASGARVIEELPARAELVLELNGAQPGSSTQLWLHAAGQRSASIELAFPADGGEATALVELEPSALLVAHIGLPAEGPVDLKPQLLDPDSREWGTPSGMRYYDGLGKPNGPDDRFLFEGLTPGLWRVFDDRSKLASDGVELAPGEREVHVELELGGLEWVTGRVELDDPGELARVRVLMLEAGAQPVFRFDTWRETVSGAHLRGDTFRLRVPAEREVELVAWHPWLTAEVDIGRTSVRGGRDGLVLRLRVGDELRLPTPGVDPHPRSLLRVGRYAGEPVGAPLAWHPAVIVDGAARCGLPSGRWTLWIDPESGFAPIVLRDIEIAGVTELPAPALVPGSSIRLKILVPEGQAVPRVYLNARRQEGPSYYRGINSDHEAEVVLSGLGSGRFRVRVNTIMNRHGLPEREIKLDGVNDFELELDLR